MPRDYFCVIQWSEHVPTADAILDPETRFFRHFEEAEAYAMSWAYAQVAARNVGLEEIQTVMHETGLVITVDAWTCVIRAFVDT